MRIFDQHKSLLSPPIHCLLFFGKPPNGHGHLWNRDCVQLDPAGFSEAKFLADCDRRSGTGRHAFLSTGLVSAKDSARWSGGSERSVVIITGALPNP